MPTRITSQEARKLQTAFEHELFPEPHLCLLARSVERILQHIEAEQIEESAFLDAPTDPSCECAACCEARDDLLDALHRINAHSSARVSPTLVEAVSLVESASMCPHGIWSDRPSPCERCLQT